VLHNHIEGFDPAGETVVAAYLQGWIPVFAARPDTIIYSTVAGGKTPGERFGHYGPLASAGMKMGTLDPGSVNLGTHGEDGLPGPGSFVYRTSFRDIAALVEIHRAHRLGPSIAIYEPGFLRTTLAYELAGRLPAGAFVKLYFSGPYNFVDGKRSPVTFGLPPTRKALEAYLEMMEASALPWAASVLGGCVSSSGMARLAIERGGHIRVGLEDYAGEDRPTNAKLVAEVVEIARSLGRPVATPLQAAKILGLPRA
jgi:3-keto-5-aminohexanoate cleavage enzyme